jgi:hypothetical protein
MDDEHEPKQIDLHETQWDREGKKQPFWGENGHMFAFYLIVGIPLGLLVQWVGQAAFAAFGL